MTTLDPSHFPLFPSFSSSSDPRKEGQATVSSVSPSSSLPLKTQNASSSLSSSPTRTKSTSPKSEAREDKVRELKRKSGRIPTPPLPDFRFEEGVLLSIRPFLHRRNFVEIQLKEGKGVDEEGRYKEEDEQEQEHHDHGHEGKKEAAEKGAIVSQSFTSEGIQSGESNDLFNIPLRIEWLNLIYILFRDQVIYSLIQGFIFGIGGVGLNTLWKWNENRLRLAKSSLNTGSSSGSASSSASGGGSRSLLARLGLKL